MTGLLLVAACALACAAAAPQHSLEGHTGQPVCPEGLIPAGNLCVHVPPLDSSERRRERRFVPVGKVACPYGYQKLPTGSCVLQPGRYPDEEYFDMERQKRSTSIIPGCPEGYQWVRNRCVPNPDEDYFDVKRQKRSPAIIPSCPEGFQRVRNICVRGLPTLDTADKSSVRRSGMISRTNIDRCPHGSVPLSNKCVPETEMPTDDYYDDVYRN